MGAPSAHMAALRADREKDQMNEMVIICADFFSEPTCTVSIAVTPRSGVEKSEINC